MILYVSACQAISVNDEAHVSHKNASTEAVSGWTRALAYRLHVSVDVVLNYRALIQVCSFSVQKSCLRHGTSYPSLSGIFNGRVVRFEESRQDAAKCSCSTVRTLTPALRTCADFPFGALLICSWFPLSRERLIFRKKKD